MRHLNLIKYLTLQITIGLFALVLLTACSNNQYYKRQADDDEIYLHAPELRDLKSPSGIILPHQNKKYSVPNILVKGEVGKKLDIRPPVHPLTLRNVNYAQCTNGICLLNIENGLSIITWSKIVNLINSYKYSILQNNNISQQLVTDWIQWPRADEDHQYRGRYQISLKNQKDQQILTVHLLELKQLGKTIICPMQIQRYTVQMMNKLTCDLDQLDEI